MAEIEHAVKVLTADRTLQEELQKLEAEGWSLVPGVLPVVVYNLVRQKKEEEQPGMGAFGKIRIDDTKVHVLRDGILIPLGQA